MTKGEKKKARWDKIRAQKAAEREKELDAPTVTFKKYVKPFREMEPRTSRHVMTEGMLRTKELPSHTSTEPRLHESTNFIELTPEMVERERLAQIEIGRKKKMVAPLYSKGAYQYVGDAPPEIVRNLGRKV